MKLNDLSDALVAEVERLRPRLRRVLPALARLPCGDPALLEALETYADRIQQLGDTATRAGLDGAQALCHHVLENLLLLPAHPAGERAPLVDWLSAWPDRLAQHLRLPADADAAEALVQHLEQAPQPMARSRAQMLLRLAGGAGPAPVDAPLAAPVAAPDPVLLDSFVVEAPRQARRLVQLAERVSAGLAGDAERAEAARLTHTFKGSAAILGVQPLAQLSHQIEELLATPPAGSGAALAPLAARVLVDAALALEQWVGHVAGLDVAPAEAAAGAGATLLDAEAAPVATSAPPAAPPCAPPGAPSGASPEPAAEPLCRVGQRELDDAVRLADALVEAGAAIESRIHSLAQHSHALLRRTLQLEAGLRTAAGGEATSPGVPPAAGYVRALALRLDEDIAQVGSAHGLAHEAAQALRERLRECRGLPFATLEPRLQRALRATVQATGKPARLQLLGGGTRLDPGLLSRLAEPLLHLLRNAVDHGLETAAQRSAAGKPPQGRVDVELGRVGGHIVLRVADDGRGLDALAIHRRAIERGLVARDQALGETEAARLILLPGFSTRDEVSDTSGRGLGLDVVNTWVQAAQGTLHVDSRPGWGCSFELRLPDAWGSDRG